MRRRVFTPEPRPHGAQLAAAEARVAELTEENAGIRELLDIEPSYDAVCRRLGELEKHAAEIHKLIGRGTHDDAVMDFECALSALHDVLQASRENSENNAQLEEQIATLTTELASGTLSPNQARVTAWVHEVFDEAESTNAPERSLRAAEEVIELTQACGLPRESLHRLVDYVYGRPVGDPRKEVSGCLLTVYAAASALGVDAQQAFEDEMTRVWQPEVIERVRARQKEKREATVLPNVMDAPNGPECACGRSSTHESGWCGHLDCGYANTQPNTYTLPTLTTDQRNALWQLLDDIDTLDDAAREHDDVFRERARTIQKKRWDIYNPDPEKA